MKPRGSELLVLPSNLIEAVKRQQAILFLGAGASIGAEHPSNAKVPSGLQLRDMISDEFLGGALKHRSLVAVSDIAANERSLLDIQKYVHDLFLPFQPAAFHKMIPSFRWRAIISTNYDLIIERAYEQARGAKQSLVKQYKDMDGFDTRLREVSDPLEFIKLHGTIDHYLDVDVPFILGMEQYAKYAKHRKQLYRRLEGMAYENPIVFCGYAIEDPHIQQIMFDLADQNIARKMYFSVSPTFDEHEERYWAKHKLTVIRATFGDFLEALDRQVPETSRSLRYEMGGGQLSLRTHYKVANAQETASLSALLENDVFHVHQQMKISHQDPKDFYKGFDTGWGFISGELDVRRKSNDAILLDAILIDEETRKTAELYILKGPAGNGKSVALKRIAWEASINYGQIILFLREAGSLRTEAIEEIYRLTGKRVFVFIDRVAIHRAQVFNLVTFANAHKIPITVIGAERDGDWNSYCLHLERFVVQNFPVHYFNEEEIERLVDLLNKHKSFGVLAEASKKEQIEAFVKRAQRQILVALHEVTLGSSFEDIVKDEFDSINNADAKALYLLICTLHQFGAPVRAGLVSRSLSIDIENFKNTLLLPLENIVFVEIDPYLKDNFYRSRHQYVAELVFNAALPSEVEKYDQFISVLSSIDVGYSSDMETFARMIKGKVLAKMFNNIELGRKLFERALEAASNRYHVYHQLASFEMQHKAGSLEKAEEYGRMAADNPQPSRAVNHTRAEIARRRANDASDPLLKASLRKTAYERLALSPKQNEFDLHTKALLAIDKVKDILAGGFASFSDRDFLEASKEAEEALGKGLQLDPDSAEMLTAEAHYRDLIYADETATKALKKAFEANPRQDWVAVRYAKRIKQVEGVDQAMEVLRKCLLVNPASKSAHLLIAKFTMEKDPKSPLILQHLRSAYSNGDNNYEAQFWFARQLFIEKGAAEAKVAFDAIHANAPGSFRGKAIAPVMSAANIEHKVEGSLARIEENYAFVDIEGYEQSVFASRSDSIDTWTRLRARQTVTCSIAFNRRGAKAVKINPAVR